MKNKLDFLKENKNKIVIHPEISLLCIYPKELKKESQMDIWSHMYKVALFTIF
jgi:hypothetical protein